MTASNPYKVAAQQLDYAAGQMRQAQEQADHLRDQWAQLVLSVTDSLGVPLRTIADWSSTTRSSVYRAVLRTHSITPGQRFSVDE